MALDRKVGTLTCPASAGQLTVTTTFEPKVVLFWYGESSSNNSFVADTHKGFGWATGTAAKDQYAIGVSADDALGTKNEAKPRIQDDACILMITDANPGVVTIEANLFESFATTSTGFKLDFVTTISGVIVQYLALGGDITNVFDSDFTQGATIGDVSVTAPGFLSDVVLFMHDGKATSFPGTGGKGIGIGMAVSSSEQWATSMLFKTEIAKADKAGGHQKTTECIIASKGPPSVESESNFKTMDTNGFTVTVGVAKSDFLVPYLCIKGSGDFGVKLGVETQRTSVGTKTTSGLGIDPDLLFMVGCNNVSTASGILDAKQTIGATDGTVEGCCWGGGEDDPTSETHCDSRQSNTKLFIHCTPLTTPTLDAECNLDNFGTGAFTLDWTTADGVAREFCYCAMKGAVAGGATAALTGVAGSSAIGSVEGNITIPLTGVVATAAVGTLGIIKSLALAGVLATSAVGLVGFTEAGNVGLTGVVGTSAPGNITQSRTVNLTGVSAASNVGTIALGVVPVITGVEAPSAVGSVGFTKSGSAALTGVVGTSAVGSVGFTEAGSVGLTGVVAASTVGTMGVSIGASVALTGVVATPFAGNVSPVTSQALIGVAVPGAVGSLTLSTSTPLDGVQGASGAGSVGFTEAGSVGLTGVAVSGAVGSVGFTKSGSIEITGVVGASAVESIAQGTAVLLIGQQANSAVGTITSDISISLTGVVNTTAVGAVGFTEAGSVGLTGVEVPSAVGTVTALTDSTSALTGVQVTSAPGSVVQDTSNTIAGNVATSVTGNVSPNLVISLTGVQSTTATGAVGFTESGNVGLTGVQATSVPGSVGFTKFGSVSTTGVQTAGIVGSITLITSISLTGVEATSAVGIVTAPTGDVVVPIIGVSATGVEGSLDVLVVSFVDGVATITDSASGSAIVESTRSGAAIVESTRSGAAIIKSSNSGTASINYKQRGTT